MDAKHLLNFTSETVTEEFMLTTDLVLLPITFVTLVYLLHFAYRTKCLRFYARFILALVILVVSYVANIVSLR